MLGNKKIKTAAGKGVLLPAIQRKHNNALNEKLKGLLMNERVPIWKHVLTQEAGKEKNNFMCLWLLLSRYHPDISSCC